MYRLTDRMLQHLEKDLKKFHDLFSGGRCQAWQLEELIARAIRSDFTKNEKVVWKGNGHDIGCNIRINDTIAIQIKSGKIKKDQLILSGHRLGRFRGNLQEITNFLNSNEYILIAVPCTIEETELGQSYEYQLVYLDTSLLHLADYSLWTEQVGARRSKKYCAKNQFGVHMELSPSMSWQIWWYVPLNIIQDTDKTRGILIR